MSPNPPVALYPATLGKAWDALPGSVRELHAGSARACGVFRVEHGPGVLARLLARLARFPPPGPAISVVLDVASDASGETWSRRFGSHSFVTRQWLRDGLLVERSGLLEFSFRLVGDERGFTFQQVSARLSLGWYRLPVPGWLVPRISARAEDASNGQVHVRVAVAAPLLGNLCTYEGCIAKEGACL